MRMHSECLTGDVFGSLRCDCGPQLEATMQRIAEQGLGAVVYLRGHEGRGIGIAHKLARRIREQGQYVGITMSGTTRRAFLPEIRDSKSGPVLRLDSTQPVETLADRVTTELVRWPRQAHDAP